MSSTADKTPDPSAERDGEGEEAFLRRWSRRKHEARTVEAAPAVDSQAPEATPLQTEATQPPVKVLTDADMPPIESLDEKSDFSMFLSSGVSEALRKQALRKLFLLPSINQRCPLDSEYYDCHGYEPLGNIITHEMREEMEREAQKLKDAAMSALIDDKQAPADTVATAAADAETPPAAAAPEDVATTEQKDEPRDGSTT